MDRNFSPMKATFESQGWLVAFRDMPWSRSRYPEGHLDTPRVASDEIVKWIKAAVAE